MPLIDSKCTYASAIACISAIIGFTVVRADEGGPAQPSSPPTALWTGTTVGAQLGYGTGGLGNRTTAVRDEGIFFPPSITGLIGGYQVGTHYQLKNNVVLGAEADVFFPSPVDTPANRPTAFATSVEYVGTVRARLGYAMGRVLPYMTGGFAWGRTRTEASDASGNTAFAKPVTHTGWTAGGGVEVALAKRWFGKFEYDHVALGSRFPGGSVAVVPEFDLFKFGLAYRFGGAAAGASSPGLSSTVWPPETDLGSWNVHAQSTVIAQGYPAFRSAVSGPYSLPAGGQTRETWTASAFLGLRVARGLEVYIDPELDQGGGIGKTLGLAGYANGEAQKGGSEFPKLRLARYFVRDTIGFGGAREKLEDGPNQLAGDQDISRLTLTAGRFAANDFFDNNVYAHDPRADFLNWSLWASAAVDFPGDLPGFTRGAVAELNRRDWTLRAGVFQVPEAQNSDVLVFRTGSTLGEFEERHTVMGLAGKLRVGAFANRGFSGDYRLALDAAGASPGLDIGTALANTRRDRLKHGFYANLEQALTDDLGLFARASWNDGRTEILAFTDVDQSLSGGLSLKGTSWGRADDRVALGGAINGLSSSNRALLAAGGLGLIIGDGSLRYRNEKIVETYYALNLDKGKTLTTDYQFIADPAYNAARGPVSIFSTRLHVEF